jgi:LPS sulfotransferase NodH
MSPTRCAAAALGATFLVGVLGATGCNTERKQECDRFLTAMKPLDQGTPGADVVDGVIKQVGAMTFQDQPLGIYAKNYAANLTVLSNTLKLKASASPPDGTDDVIKQRLKQARTDRDDVQRYCSE